MKTLFNILRQECGLSLREAAEFCEVRFDTIRNWDYDRRTPPKDLLIKLHNLSARINFVAAESLNKIRELPKSETIIIGYAVDDHEAQNHPIQWPFASTQYAMLGVLFSMMTPEELLMVRLVPRGSTVESAAAIETHEK